MVIAASSEKLRSRRRRSKEVANRLDAKGNPTASVRTTYIGLDPMFVEPGQPLPGPDELHAMAFLVEQGADTHLNSHFHPADQFQVFVSGSGAIANHVVDSVLVHFTNAFSPYGPIKGGPEGINYLTLRNQYVSRAYFMPAARDELRAANQPYREVTAHVGHPADIFALRASRGVDRKALFDESADGLGAWRYRLGPGEQASGPDPREGRGQFWVVLSGAMAQEGDDPLPPLSCVFVNPDEPRFAAKAVADGLDLLVLQFPIKAVH